MTEEQAKVAPLKKLSLHLEAGRSPDRMDLTHGPLPVTFVYGIGKSGLTPFEYELAEKVVGDDIVFSVGADQLDAFFEHLLPLLPGSTPTDPVHFRVRLENVSTASGREVIQAMASMTDGCGCGCGCGGGHEHGISNEGCGGACGTLP